MVERKNYFYLLVFFFLFFLLAISYQWSSSAYITMEKEVMSDNNYGVYKGKRATEFELMNETGEKIALSKFKGKKVVLNFFATWCGPCQEEMPVLVHLDKISAKEKLVVVGVNLTKEELNPNQVRDFVKHFQVEFDVLFDGEGKVMDEYQLIGIPTTLFIDENGIIVERVNGMITIDMIEKHSFFN